MLLLLSTINSFILLIISLLHTYWGFGGDWGIAQSLPTDEKGVSVLNPGKFACFVVALGLLGMSLYTLIYSGILRFELPNIIQKYGIWLLASIFIIRAIGDFKYVGFTRKIKNTVFAQLDSQFYTPLCLFLGVSFILIGLKL